MKLGLGQIDVVWKDRGANFERLDQLLAGCQTVPDILVLPEMFDVGYLLSADDLDVVDSEESIEYSKALCQKYGLILGGSFPSKRAEDYFNTFYFIDQTGVLHTYDKIHLFSPAGEHAVFSRGRSCRDAEVGGLRIRAQVCYDLRFPFYSFNSSDFDLLVYSANWPMGRIHHWNHLLKGRAVENQCHVIGVNRIGKDHNGYEYPGNSQIIDHHGHVVLDAGREEGVFSVDVDLSGQDLYRKKFPFTKDVFPLNND